MSDTTVSSNIANTDTSVAATNAAVATSLYTAAELGDASKRFGTSKECIQAALKEQKKTTFTIDEAAEIVKNFLIREVKR
jgi:hypothetical protein